MKKKLLIIIMSIVLSLLLLIGVFAFAISAHIKQTTKNRILSEDDASLLKDISCILVLGCLVRTDGEPSDMLQDRLLCGISLYENGVAPKLLMSGDHHREDYDEVNTMKRFAVEAGIDSSDVFMDHAGLSTYESLKRAKDIFGVCRIVIVTQEYHLHRALYIADQLGIDAYGVASDYRIYRGQWKREFREILARNKDFFIARFEPDPDIGGAPISISGDGNITNDQNTAVG